jgi:predicted MFS family arabinose efflux permease
MSVNGFSAMFGAFIFGWVADRLSPSISFGLVALLQCLCWVLVLTAGSYSILVLATIGIGLTTGGAFPPFSALVAEKYGSGSFGTAMGLTTFLKLPLTLQRLWQGCSMTALAITPLPSKFILRYLYWRAAIF